MQEGNCPVYGRKGVARGHGVHLSQGSTVHLTELLPEPAALVPCRPYGEYIADSQYPLMLPWLFSFTRLYLNGP